MTEQLVFELAAPEPPSFANFLPGHNAEALAAVQSLAAGAGAETGVLLWGAAGAGKTHLLRAATRMADARGAACTYVADPGALLAQDPETLAALKIVAIDGVDLATPEAQARLFRLFNGLKENGGQLIVASRLPPAALTMRDDLRTRLGWGLVFEILPLADTDKPAALAAYAKQRGFRLADDVVGYMLAHGRRDMSALLSTLAALDRHSLATKRPITVPMLRDWLQREIRLDP
ncbi:MAG: DnaA regulatory inactivator Hda [Betaproteobacteria bacterium]